MYVGPGFLEQHCVFCFVVCLCMPVGAGVRTQQQFWVGGLDAITGTGMYMSRRVAAQRFVARQALYVLENPWTSMEDIAVPSAKYSLLLF